MTSDHPRARMLRSGVIRRMRESDESGVVAVLAVLMVVVVFGLGAFAVDVSRAYVLGTKAQRAADAAALAAVPYLPGNVALATDAAVAAAAANGFVNGVNGTTVTVTTPFQGRASRAQVSIKTSQGNAFGPAVGIDRTGLTRSAVADFAGPVPMGSPCNLYGNTPSATTVTNPGSGVVGGGTKSWKSANCSTLPAPTAPGFWAAAYGPNTNKANGDRFMSRKCATGDFRCDGVIGNEDYYGNSAKSISGVTYYAFRIGVSASTPSLDVQLFDPVTTPSGNLCENKPWAAYVAPPTPTPTPTTTTPVPTTTTPVPTTTTPKPTTTTPVPTTTTPVPTTTTPKPTTTTPVPTTTTPAPTGTSGGGGGGGGTGAPTTPVPTTTTPKPTTTTPVPTTTTPVPTTTTPKPTTSTPVPTTTTPKPTTTTPVPTTTTPKPTTTTPVPTTSTPSPTRTATVVKPWTIATGGGATPAAVGPVIEAGSREVAVGALQAATTTSGTWPGPDNPNPFVADAKTRYSLSTWNGTGTGSGQFCTGDNYPNSPASEVITSFALVNPTATFDPMQSSIVAGCYKQFRGPTTMSTDSLVFGRPGYDATFAAGFRQWVSLCTQPITNPSAGDYYVVVRTNLPWGATAARFMDKSQDGTVTGNGNNMFGIRGIVPTGTDADQVKVKVSALERMPMYANITAGGTQTFNIARIGSSSKGLTMRLDMFDVGDGFDIGSPAGGTLTIKKPDGSTIPTCQAYGDVLGTELSPVTVANCSLSSLGINYDGRNQSLVVPIPSNYSCDDANAAACWWTISLTAPAGASPSDRTTWTASVTGDPVRLLE